MDFAGKRALITGGSSGIGLALAKKLAARGAHVTILARDAARLEIACAEIRAERLDDSLRVDSIRADVADRGGLQAALAEFARREGAPDLLINSAGVVRPGYFNELDLDVFRDMMEINYLGMVAVIKALLPGMIARGSGYIVNISSLAGFLAVYGYSAYAPSKFAVRALSDVLRYELEEHGIQVSVVFPPDTQTPQLDFENPLKPPVLKKLDESTKVLTADAVAESILRNVARGRYIITPGFDSNLYFQLTNFFGLVYPVMGSMVRQARRTVGGAKNNRTH